MRFPIVATVLIAALACGGEPADDQTARDLSLQPAESVAPLNDQPLETPPAAAPAQPPRQQPPSRPQPAAPREAPRPAAPTLAEGTVLHLAAMDTITSRNNRRGETVMAVSHVAITDAQGREVIPAGATFAGVISDIAPAESPGGEGRMVLTFNRVEFGGQTYAITARVDSLGSHMHGRGVTAGNVATVGAGAVVGGVAGRVIGGNRTGTVVGAVAGAAAGAAVARATRDIDIVLAAGAPIRIVLTAPFEARS